MSHIENTSHTTLDTRQQELLLVRSYILVQALVEQDKWRAEIHRLGEEIDTLDYSAMPLFSSIEEGPHQKLGQAQQRLETASLSVSTAQVTLEKLLKEVAESRAGLPTTSTPTTGTSTSSSTSSCNPELDGDELSNW